MWHWECNCIVRHQNIQERIWCVCFGGEKWFQRETWDQIWHLHNSMFKWGIQKVVKTLNTFLKVISNGAWQNVIVYECAKMKWLKIDHRILYSFIHMAIQRSTTHWSLLAGLQLFPPPPCQFTPQKRLCRRSWLVCPADLPVCTCRPTSFPPNAYTKGVVD